MKKQFHFFIATEGSHAGFVFIATEGSHAGFAFQRSNLLRLRRRSPVRDRHSNGAALNTGPGDIDLVFEEHAEEQYHRSLLFSSLTCLVSGVVLGKHASMNAGYKKMKEQLAVSVTAVYEKLQRVELLVVQQLVRQSYRQTIAVCKEVGCVAHNDLPGYSTRILDGNWLSGTEHRLKETRTSTAAPLPGKSLVVYDPRYHAVCDYFAMEDAYSQERSGLDDVIETLQRHELWLADRNFCTRMPRV